MDNTIPEVKKPSVMIAWSFYDWASSAFPTLVTTFIFSAYFTKVVAKNTIIGTAQWGDAQAITALLVAVCCPLFGAITDHMGRRKPWIGLFSLLSIIATAALWFILPQHNYVLTMLLLVIIATFGLEVAAVFYNAMLPHIAPRAMWGRISGWGWGVGYAGGLVCLIIALIFFVEAKDPLFPLNTELAEQIRICGPLVALWFFIFALPLFIWVPDQPPIGKTITQALHLGWQQLKSSVKKLPRNPTLLRFLIARMIYIDGLNTLFTFGGIYAAGTFNMNIDEVIQFGIAMSISAGIGAGLFAWLDDWIGAKKIILISLAAIFCLGLIIVTIKIKFYFWIFALIIGLFFGPVQAASRSFMVRIAPPAVRNEMFGLYALTGKATAFVGPWLFGMLTLLFSSQRAGMAGVMLFFLVGGAILWPVKAENTTH